MSKKKAAPKKKKKQKKATTAPSTKNLTARMSSLMAMQTTCHMTRADVSLLVIGFVRDQGFPAATETSNFSADIPVDGITRRGWAAPIRQRVFAGGCDPKGFGPADCENARTVAAIVTALLQDLQ
jgi:hypothetical protein